MLVQHIYIACHTVIINIHRTFCINIKFHLELRNSFNVYFIPYYVQYLVPSPTNLQLAFYLALAAVLIFL
jgi:hypothetical protein